jgi:hypothetical protein
MQLLGLAASSLGSPEAELLRGPGVRTSFPWITEVQNCRGKRPSPNETKMDRLNWQSKADRTYFDVFLLAVDSSDLP